MKKQGLTEWFKAGYPQFKEYSGMPAWLLPERSFSIVVDGLGDIRMAEMSRCLDLLPDTVKEPPDIGNFPAEMWRKACLDWPLLSVISPVITSLLEAGDRIVSKYHCGELTIDPQVIFRSIMVIAFAPFVSQGKTLLQTITTILGGDVTDPSHIITRYIDTVSNGDSVTVTKVIECIESHQKWACWAGMQQQLALSFNGDYRLVAVTPPLSERLADVLVDMMKEAPNYGA